MLVLGKTNISWLPLPLTNPVFLINAVPTPHLTRQLNLR